MTGLDRWYGYMKSHDRAALWDLLHPDAVFESPVVHTPQRGRDITFRYLSSAEKVLGGPGFSYIGEWRSDTGAVLEFQNEIDGITINGVDIITFSDDGRITHYAFQGDGAPAQGDEPAAPADGGATRQAVRRCRGRKVATGALISSCVGPPETV
jgi:hypothetical protein